MDLGNFTHHKSLKVEYSGVDLIDIDNFDIPISNVRNLIISQKHIKNKIKKDITGNIFIIDFAAYSHFHFIFDKILQYEFIKNFVKDLKLVLINDKGDNPIKNLKHYKIISDILLIYDINEDDIIHLSYSNEHEYNFSNVYTLTFFHSLFLNKINEDLHFEPWSYKESHKKFLELSINSFSNRINQFIKHLDIEKVFISRKPVNDSLRKSNFAAGRGRIISEDEENQIESFFIDNGYQIVVAEDYGLIDQANLFNSAKNIAMFYSSSLVNIIFCKPNTNVISLALDNSFRCWYDIVAKGLGLNFTENPKHDKYIESLGGNIELFYSNDIIKSLKDLEYL